VKVCFREFEIRFAVHSQCGTDVQEYGLVDTIGVVDKQFVSYSCAAIMGADVIGGVPQFLHHEGDVTCHETFGILSDA